MPKNQHIESKQSNFNAWGRSTIKIINSCLAYGLPVPKITEKNGGIEVSVLSSNQVSNQVELVERLVESQQKIIELIASNPKISKREMSSFSHQ
ncbi:MAG: hypothetical protein WEA99_00560 [Brumimicrobium sp.]